MAIEAGAVLMTRAANRLCLAHHFSLFLMFSLHDAAKHGLMRMALPLPRPPALALPPPRPCFRGIKSLGDGCSEPRASPSDA